ncbi:MAG: serpin family protein [Candidatus Cloacimonetes bacterium]|nr:serpin family protein [Candidatus Cloacimonadota bacterium]
MRKFCVSLILIGILILGCSSKTTSPGNGNNDDYSKVDSLAYSVDEELTSANLKFALKIFNKIEEQNSNENIFISPLSLSIALAMTYNGALEGTYEAMSTTLEFQNMSLDEVNEEFLKLIKSLQRCDSKVELSIANSIWIRDGFPVKPDFIERNENFYLSQVSNLDFNLPNAPDIINTWVEENTNGKITDLIQQISPDEMMFLINALYFKGQWKFQFDEADTEEDIFHLSDETTKTVLMMKSSGKDYKYYFDNNFSAVRMPYGRDKVSMYVFLPGGEYNLDDFIASIDAENWNNWMNSFDSLANIFEYEEEYECFEFGLPKFKLEYEKELNDALIALGMGIAFNPSANFGGMSDVKPLWINYVKQKAFIEVNEQGSEAAAATVVSMTSGIPPNFIVNRPFFFVIRDDRSETILFMGKILDPSYE